jgi:hypothetical protein
MTISATSCVRSEYLALRRVILLCMTKLNSVTLKMSLLRHRHILKPLVGAQMWREYIKLQPRPGTSREEEHEALQQLWQPSDTVLLEELKQELIDGPILKRPDF